MGDERLGRQLGCDERPPLSLGRVGGTDRGAGYGAER